MDMMFQQTLLSKQSWMFETAAGNQNYYWNSCFDDGQQVGYERESWWPRSHPSVIYGQFKVPQRKSVQESWLHSIHSHTWTKSNYLLQRILVKWNIVTIVSDTYNPYLYSVNDPVLSHYCKLLQNDICKLLLSLQHFLSFQSAAFQ